MFSKKTEIQNKMDLVNLASSFRIKLSQSDGFKSVFKHEDIETLKELRKCFKQESVQDYLGMVFALIDDMVYIKNKTFLKYQNELKNHMSDENYSYIYDQCQIKFLTNDSMINKILKIVRKSDQNIINARNEFNLEKQGECIQ